VGGHAGGTGAVQPANRRFHRLQGAGGRKKQPLDHAAHARRAGDLAARYGGEEFVLLMPGCSGRDALTAASALCERLFARGLPHALSNHGAVSVSIGVCCVVPSASSTPQDLIEAADRALYKAKEDGRNCAYLAS